jgi:predicted RNA polymerase sigma factor
LAAISQKAHCSRHTFYRYQANWADVAQLYDALFALAASPVIAINRALAIAEIHGVSAALDALLCFHAARLPGPLG